jgi:Tripartite tricarboxylate transporter family receptor
MKLPRRKFLHLAAGTATLPTVSRIARAQAYPSRPVRIVASTAPGGLPDILARLIGPLALGAARPAIRRRKPPGWRLQHRHRSGRACRTGRLHTSLGEHDERDQRDALRQAQFRFYPRHRAGRRHHARAQCHGRASVGSGQNNSRVHCLCAWSGIGAPKNTPAEIIDTLNKEINAALADPNMKARLADLGGTALALSPADFGKFIAEEIEKWGKVIRAANIKPE